VVLLVIAGLVSFIPYILFKTILLKKLDGLPDYRMTYSVDIGKTARERLQQSIVKLRPTTAVHDVDGCICVAGLVHIHVTDVGEEGIKGSNTVGHRCLSVIRHMRPP